VLGCAQAEGTYQPFGGGVFSGFEGCLYQPHNCSRWHYCCHCRTRATPKVMNKAPAGRQGLIQRQSHAKPKRGHITLRMVAVTAFHDIDQQPESLPLNTACLCRCCCHCCPGPSWDERPKFSTAEALLIAAAALNAQGKHWLSLGSLQATPSDSQVQPCIDQNKHA